MGDRDKYTAFSIPKRDGEPDKGAVTDAWKNLAKAVLSPIEENDKFAEIEYEYHPHSASGVKKEKRRFTLVPASQLIGKRTTDPVKEKFLEMRSFAPLNAFARDDADLFYKQGKFMEDFADDFQGNEPFSMYYPYYQHMSYNQLRTYFTWRTKVRSGEMPPTSASYIFLYLYELLSGIGAESPADGLDKLMAIWTAYRELEPVLEKYIPKWLRDYHIYYELPHSFEDYINQHDLRGYYPEMFLSGADEENSLILWNGISGYDVMKSKFYNDGNEELLNGCFYAVLEGVQELCAEQNARFEHLLIYRVSKGSFWRPFDGALFCHHLNQPDRQVEIPGGERFYCRNGRWTADISIYFSGRKELVGYLIKKTEACLRQAVQYKYIIKAERAMLPNEVLRKLKEAGIPFAALKKSIEKTVSDYHKGLRRKVKVEVDHMNLARIRDEALGTQNKLIVPEDDMPAAPVIIPAPRELTPFAEQQDGSASPAVDEWEALKAALSEVERKALRIAILKDADVKAFANENGVMPEVLADGINDKAMDYIGDSILELDGDMVIYDEYMEKVTEMVD